MDKEINPNLLLKDAGFELDPPGFYQMILTLGRTSLEAVVFDPSRKKFIAFIQYNIPGNSGKKEYFEQVGRIMAADELLRLPYKNIRVIWQSQTSTLVPAPLFDIGARESYLQFNQGLDAGDVVISDNIRNADAYNIFAVPAELYTAVGSLHPRIHHHASVLIETLLLLNRHNINPMQVFVNVHTGFFDMVVINERKLRFYNSFAYNSVEDFIYFVLYVFEQLKLMPEKDMVTLSGQILKNSPIYDIMYKYIRYLTFAGPIGQVTESYILQDIEAYQYQTLFNSILCEL